MIFCDARHNLGSALTGQNIGIKKGGD